MAQSVHDMFDSISRRYDLTNDVLSFGMHRLWRQTLVKNTLIKNPTLPASPKILDLCTGTGDLAFALHCAAPRDSTVIGLDFVGSMLNIAQAKSKQRQTAAKADSTQPQFLKADAMQLPFPAQSFDLVTISFGIRNVPEPIVCLKEMYRVLKPGGQVKVLEFGQAQAAGFKQFYNFFCKHLMPRIGGILTKNKAAYEYLPETSKRFPAGPAFAELLKQAGFTAVRYTPLLSGVSYIYEGRVP